MDFFPAEGGFLGIDEGENGAGDDGDVGAADEFEEAEGVSSRMGMNDQSEPES
jgi:hypothetical protein